MYDCRQPAGKCEIYLLVKVLYVRSNNQLDPKSIKPVCHSLVLSAVFQDSPLPCVLNTQLWSSRAVVPRFGGAAAPKARSRRLERATEKFEEGN